MLHYNRIDFSEENVYKTGESKEWDICQYYYFLSKQFKFQPYAYKH